MTFGDALGYDTPGRSPDAAKYTTGDQNHLFNHVHYSVDDVAKTADWYERILGMKFPASAKSPSITSPLGMTTVRIHSPNLLGVLVRPLTIQTNRRGARRPVGNANIGDPVMRSAGEPGFNIFAFEAGGGSV